MLWFYGSESVEHFFGITRQLNSNFDFSDLIQMLSKISQYTKALRSNKLVFDQEKNVCQDTCYLTFNCVICLSNAYNLLKYIYIGYHFDYLSGKLDESILEMLRF